MNTKKINVTDKLARYRLLTVGGGPLNDGSSRLVDARDLHKALDSKREFPHWMAYQIERLGLVEFQDYVPAARPSKQDFHTPVHGVTDYFLHPMVALQLALLGAARKPASNSVD